jgi:hypothetical protein
MTYEQAEKIAATIEHKCGGGSDYRVGAETLLEELDKAGAFAPVRRERHPHASPIEAWNDRTADEDDMQTLRGAGYLLPGSAGYYAGSIITLAGRAAGLT